MDTPSVIREYLDENRINATRSVEIAYRYHAELESGHRIAGCEIIMRAVGDDVFVRAELPISVMAKESRGVVKYLADLNKERISEGKQGYFDLDYVAGKIVFAIRVRQPITKALLREVAQYCISQIEYESDELLKVLCEECEAIRQEEEELRQQREREMRQPGLFGSLMRRLKNMIDEIIEPDRPRRRPRRGLPVYAPFDEPEYDYNFDDDDAPYTPHSRARTAYRPGQARPSGFGMNREPEDEYEEGDQGRYAAWEREEPVKSPGTAEEDETEEKAPEANPENEPDPENKADEAGADEEEENGFGMSQEEFNEFLSRHIYPHSVPEDEEDEEEFEADSAEPDEEEDYFEHSAPEMTREDAEDDNVIYLGPVKEEAPEKDQKAEEDRKGE